VARRIGRRVGADYIVLGGLTKIREDIRLDVRLIGITGEDFPLSVYAEPKSIDEAMMNIGHFAREIGNKMGGSQPEPEMKDPVFITNSYAVDKGPYGAIWKIYIEVQAIEAEIIRIAAKVEQSGEGRYPPSIIFR
jgi:hypothetical protein